MNEQMNYSSTNIQIDQINIYLAHSQGHKPLGCSVVKYNCVNWQYIRCYERCSVKSEGRRLQWHEDCNLLDYTAISNKYSVMWVSASKVDEDLSFVKVNKKSSQFSLVTSSNPTKKPYRTFFIFILLGTKCSKDPQFSLIPTSSLYCSFAAAAAPAIRFYKHNFTASRVIFKTLNIFKMIIFVSLFHLYFHFFMTVIILSVLYLYRQ